VLHLQQRKNWKLPLYRVNSLLQILVLV